MTTHTTNRQWILYAVLAGCMTAAFRVLSSPGFTNDHFMHLAWARQMLFGELPGRDFVEPGMPLVVVLSAIAQWVAPNPLSEELLTSGMLGLAAGLTFLLVARLSGSRLVALGATLFELALQPRLYSYPKILVPVLAVLALRWYLARPSTIRLTAPAATTAIAFLFRHDLGLFAGAGIVVGLWAATDFSVRRTALQVRAFVALTAGLLVPYLLFVQWSEGVVEHFRRGVEFSKGEAHQLWPPLPAFESRSLAEWLEPNAATLLVWSTYALLAVGLAWLIWARRHRTREAMAVATAIVTIFGAYVLVILRHPLPTRLPDLAGILAVTGGWLTSEFIPALARERVTRPVVAGVAAAGLVAVLAAATVTTSTMTRLMERVDDSALLLGPTKVEENIHDIVASRTTWPWPQMWPSGVLPPVIPYLDHCTAASDRLLLTWPAPEYLYFARRLFAAGHGIMLQPPAFETERDRAEMQRWLAPQRVPIVLINEDRRSEFVRGHPDLDADIRDRYEAAGTFTAYDGATITIAVRKDLHPTSRYEPQGWPCGFEPSTE